MDDTALNKDTFDVHESELKINEVPALLTDPSEYELELLGKYMSNDSEDVVKDVLGSTRDLIDEYTAVAMEALEALGDYPSGSVPESDISISLPDAPEVDDLSATKPTRPAYDTPDVGDAPEMRGALREIDPAAIDVPEYTMPDEPSDTLEWSEDPYVSTLLTNITAALNDIIVDGGTGLDPDWEQHVYDRAVSRLDLEFESKYDEAERFYSSKRHVAPPGGLMSRLNLLNRDHAEKVGLISSDIAAKHLEIAHDHKKFCLDLGKQIEGLNMQQRSDVMNRALDAAKSTIALLYDLYKTQLEGVRYKIEIYKTRVDAETARIGAIAESNKSITDTLTAETQAWAARINAEFSLVESIIRMYTADMGGYEAEVRAEAVKIQALIDRYRAQVESANVQGQISLGEYEQLVKAILGEIQLKIGSSQEAGRIAAQIAASALSALSASASISDSVSKTKGYHEQKSLSMSNSFQQSLSNQLGISYSKNDQAQDSYGESKIYQYSASVSSSD